MEDYLDLRLAMTLGSIAALLILYSRWGWSGRIVGVGLVPAYLLSLGLIHWPGAILYLLPWYWGGDAPTVEAGFVVSVYAVLALIVTFTRPRPAWLLIGLILAYLGVSFYVTYMRDRATIRDVVWAGAPVEDRLTQLGRSASDFEFFDPYDVAQLQRIDARLNQNFLVGAAVRYL